MKFLLKFAALIVSCCTALAQEPAADRNNIQHKAGIALGIGHTQWKDHNSSPLTYRSIPKVVRLFYALENNDFIATLDCNVKVGGMKSRQHPGRTVFFQEENYKGEKADKKFPVGGSFLSASLSLGAFYKLSASGKTGSSVGIRIKEEMMYPQSWVSSGMLNAISFSPAVYVAHAIDWRSRVIATVDLPVAAYVSRLPYHNTVSAPNKTLIEGFFSNSGWKGMTGFLAPGLGLQYHYQHNRNLSTGVHYDATFFRVRDPQVMSATSQSLLASFTHPF